VKTALIGIAYAAVLLIAWEIQKFDLLLGHTLGVLGILATTVFLADHLARKVI
jgi:hypothetical protein